MKSLKYILFSFTIFLLSCNNNEIENQEGDTTIEDVEGNKYKTLEVNDQLWMAENLVVTKFRNGDPIPEAKTMNEWKTAFYNNQPAFRYSLYYNTYSYTTDTLGVLYNWFAVMDPRGLSPDGWVIPTKSDYDNFLEVMKPFKDYVNSYYNDQNYFWALWVRNSVGRIDENGKYLNSFDHTNWWSLTKSNQSKNNQAYTLDSYLNIIESKLIEGHSVRCLKNFNKKIILKSLDDSISYALGLDRASDIKNILASNQLSDKFSDNDIEEGMITVFSGDKELPFTEDEANQKISAYMSNIEDENGRKDAGIAIGMMQALSINKSLNEKVNYKDFEIKLIKKGVKDGFNNQIPLISFKEANEIVKRYIGDIFNKIDEDEKESNNDFSLKFEDLYEILKKSILNDDAFCEPIAKVDETKIGLDFEVRVYSDEYLLSVFTVNKSDLNKRKIDGDDIDDYEITIINSGGGCGGNIEMYETWVLYGSNPTEFRKSKK